MNNAANVVPVIDTSHSMTDNGYVNITQRDSKAFVSHCKSGDGLGVVGFDDIAHIAHSFSVVDSRAQVDAATEAIQRLSFTGVSTAIGLGLQAAEKMLDSHANPRGIVLLSDGFNNSGPAPLDVLPSGYPVYACAMGPIADYLLMSEISQRTGGTPHVAPTPYTLMKIFNDIRGQEKFVRTVMNTIDTIKPQDYALIPVPISSANSAAQFGVVWGPVNDSQVVLTPLSYTNSSNPSASQISVTLVEPKAQDASILEPRFIGTGYVVFDVPDVQSGEWFVQIISGGTAPVLVTIGAFEFPANQKGAADLIISVPASIRAGEPLSVQAHVVENGEPLQSLQVRAEVAQPILSVSNALSAYKDELKKIELTEKDFTRGVPEDRLRLARLRTKLLSQRDILAHRSYPLILREGLESRHGARLEGTHQAGSYNIHVVATGRSPETGTTFQRTRLTTVLVTD